MNKTKLKKIDPFTVGLICGAIRKYQKETRMEGLRDFYYKHFKPKEYKKFFTMKEKLEDAFDDLFFSEGVYVEVKNEKK